MLNVERQSQLTEHLSGKLLIRGFGMKYATLKHAMLCVKCHSHTGYFGISLTHKLYIDLSFFLGVL